MLSEKSSLVSTVMLSRSKVLPKVLRLLEQIQGSTLSSHRITTGFGPFEHLTCGLLPKGRDYSPPEFCFVRSPAFWLAVILMGIHSAMNVQITTNWRWG